MADLSKIRLNGINYNLKDAEARNAINNFEETDPTVPAWAKAANKPTYTANEVGALPNTTVIPTITDTYSSTSHNGMSGVAVNSAITTAIGNINSFDIAVVSSTSAVTTPNNHTIYFVPQAVNSSTHDEYMYINNNWELIGTTTIDLSGYLQKTEIADWAKAANKPTYTAAEVGAVPSRVSSQGTSGYINNTSGNIEISEQGNQSGSAKLSLIGPNVVLSSTKDMSNSSITLKTNNVNNIVLSEGNTTITGVVTPTSNTMAANKQYVDNAVSNITHPTYTLSISGNRITLTPSSGTASYIDLPVYDGSYEEGSPIA